MSGRWLAKRSGDSLPHSRTAARLFWSGNQVVRVGNGQSAMYGASFVPSRNVWTKAVFARVSWRDQYASVWTGDDAIVWGGASDLGQLKDGAAFSPARQTWRTIAESPLVGRNTATAAWTGEEMVVIGGGTDRADFFSDCAAYNPTRDEWRMMPDFPGDARFGAGAVWTGREVVVWGGVLPTEFATDGAAYDPTSNKWRSIAPSPLIGRMDCSVVWTGREMVVWGGTERRADDGAGHFNDGAAYDPATDMWRGVPPAPIPGRYSHSAVWTGDRMIVWGGADTLASDAPPRTLSDGASLDPATGEWTALPAGPLASRYQHNAVWIGEEMLVAGGCCRDSASADAFGDVASFRPD